MSQITQSREEFNQRVQQHKGKGVKGSIYRHMLQLCVVEEVAFVKSFIIIYFCLLNEGFHFSQKWKVMFRGSKSVSHLKQKGDEQKAIRDKRSAPQLILPFRLFTTDLEILITNNCKFLSTKQVHLSLRVPLIHILDFPRQYFQWQLSSSLTFNEKAVEQDGKGIARKVDMGKRPNLETQWIDYEN